jgi:hypothetical protein
MTQPAIAVQAQEPLPELRRLGKLLLLFFFVHVLSILVDQLVGEGHSFTIDLMSLILGALLLNGSLGAARVLAFLTSSQIASTAAGIVIGGLMAAVFVPHEWLVMVGGELTVWAVLWAIAAIAIEVAIAFYLLRVLRSPAVEAALSVAGKRPMRGPIRWGAGCAIGGWLLAALIAVTVMPLIKAAAGAVEGPAKAKAAAILGEGWSCTMTRFSSGGGTWKAHLVCTRGGERRELDLASE